MVKKKVLEDILESLHTTVWGCTIEEIASITGYHRNTISKYMPVLEAAGLVMKRKIGKYTFWFLRNVFDYHKKKLAEYFFEILILSLKDITSIDFYSLGKKIGEKMMELGDFKKKGLIEHIQTKAGIFREFIGVYIPTVVPGLSFKFENFELNSDEIKISVLSKICSKKNVSENFKEFLRGYISGILDFLKIPYTDIRNANDSKTSCEFIIKLKKTIREIMISSKT